VATEDSARRQVSAPQDGNIYGELRQLRAKGRRVGRPSVVAESQLVHAVQLRRAGQTIAEIIAATGLTRSTLYRHLARAGT